MITTTLASPARTYRAFTHDELHRVAPSIFTPHAQPRVSNRYAFVSTADVIEVLRDQGWVPVLAKEQRVRADHRRGFQLHEVRFARMADVDGGLMEVGDVRPEIVLQNAHDATRAYRIDAGLYRLACRNGLVVADAMVAHVSIRHVDANAQTFAAAAQAVAQSAPRLLEQVAQWRTIPLPPVEQIGFARQAASLRWGTSHPITRGLDPMHLLRPLQYYAAERDLWSTFNAIQGNVIRGGVHYRASGYVRIRRGTTRPLMGLRTELLLNKGLWELAGSFADRAGRSAA